MGRGRLAAWSAPTWTSSCSHRRWTESSCTAFRWAESHRPRNLPSPLSTRSSCPPSPQRAHLPVDDCGSGSRRGLPWPLRLRRVAGRASPVAVADPLEPYPGDKFRGDDARPRGDVLDVPFLSLFIQQVMGYSPLRAGFAFLPFSVGIVIGAGISSTLMSRINARYIAATGPRVVRRRAQALSRGTRSSWSAE